MRLFEIAIFYVPTEKQVKEGKTAKIIKTETLLCKDEKAAQFQAARMVPEEYVDLFDEVTVACRPF